MPSAGCDCSQIMEDKHEEFENIKEGGCESHA